MAELIRTGEEFDPLNAEAQLRSAIEVLSAQFGVPSFESPHRIATKDPTITNFEIYHDLNDRGVSFETTRREVGSAGRDGLTIYWYTSFTVTATDRGDLAVSSADRLEIKAGDELIDNPTLAEYSDAHLDPGETPTPEIEKILRSIHSELRLVTADSLIAKD